MELNVVAGQLYVVNGESHRSGNVPGLLVQTSPSRANRSRNRDYLFVHLTLSGQIEETKSLTEDLLEGISQEYFNSSGSITAALRNAIIEINGQLLSYNLGTTERPREGALTCAVLRDQELFVAQVGEAVALLGRNFGIERLPPTGTKMSQPLGQTAGVPIRYYHQWLQEGDMLLLADPKMAHTSAEAFNSVLIDSDVETGVDLLQTMIGVDSARVILVELTDEAPGYIPDTSRTDKTKPQSRRLSAPVKGPVREGENSASRQESESTNGQTSSIPAMDVESVELTARRATSKAAIGLSAGTAWLADMLEKIRSPAKESDTPSNWTVPTILAIAIPIIVAVVVVGVYVQRGQAAEFSELKHAINNNLTLAKSAATEAEAESYYQNALKLANDAEQLRPDDGDIARYRQTAISGMDGLSGVARLDGRQLIAFPVESNLVSIALSDPIDSGIFVLDSEANAVYNIDISVEEGFDMPADIEPFLVVFGEQVLGSHIVGTIRDLLWRPQGNQVTRDGVAMLDERGAIVSHFPNFADTRAVSLGLASEWVNPTQIATFNERMYVLDPGADLIWRYFAEGEGFTTSEGQRSVEFVEDAGIDQVVDFAIYSEDGSVILLYNDGRLRRYVNGRLLWSEEDLSSNGLQSPLIAPSALKIVGKGLNSSIFIADPGSERIVQLSLGGIFLAQFKASDAVGDELFARTSDFEVLENPLRIIVTAGNEIYVAEKG